MQGNVHTCPGVDRYSELDNLGMVIQIRDIRKTALAISTGIVLIAKAALAISENSSFD